MILRENERAFAQAYSWVNADSTQILIAPFKYSSLSDFFMWVQKVKFTLENVQWIKIW